MATISKRGNYQYQAIIRRKGYPTQTKTFETKKDAEAWAHDIESQQDRGHFKDRREIEGTTLKEALERYLQNVSIHKRGHVAEGNRIRQLQAHPLAARTLDTLQAKDFAAYRDKRLQLVSANTTRLELAILSHLYTIAIEEWSLPLEHALKSVKKPAPGPARERRLQDGEEKNLHEALGRPTGRGAQIWLGACIRLAIETGMRASEILTLEWSQLRLNDSIIRLNRTKNGTTRSVPLSLEAVRVLTELPRHIGGRAIPNFHDTSGLDRAFKLLCKAANINDLHFHDLRHEAASRLAPHMPAQTLAKVMGWKSLQMAMRYYNPKDEELVEIVRRATGT